MSETSKSSKIPSSILFVCYLNSIRSPMGEGLARKLLGDGVHIRSCGESKGDLDSLMVAVMKEKGIDMSGHEAQKLTELNDSSFDLIIAFTEGAGAAAEAAFAGQDVTIETWTTPDPTMGVLDVRAMMNNYRAVRDQIEGRLKRHFDLG